MLSERFLNSKLQPHLLFDCSLILLLLLTKWSTLTIRFNNTTDLIDALFLFSCFLSVGPLPHGLLAYF